jgi:mannose-6-phosphate isomerase-like protein (cupin superfamily)
MQARILGLGFLAAMVCSASAFAQSTNSQIQSIVPPGPPAANGQGLHGTLEAQKKALPPGHNIAMSIFAWTPNYRVSLLERAPYADDTKAGSEMHEDKTQIYFVLSGSGVQVLGGKPDTEKDVGNGNHASEGTPVGGKSYRIKAGDVIVIPPMTWHQTRPDAGQPITYQMVDVETRTRMP